MPRKQTKPKPTEGQSSLFDGIVPDDADTWPTWTSMLLWNSMRK
jgi:hypothetical protein